MGKRSTRLRIAFFSIILAGLIVIQYSWIKSLQNDKLREFRSRIISAIAKEGISLDKSAHEMNDPAIGKMPGQSFLSTGLGDIPFEFSISSTDNHLASHGFSQKLTKDPGNLTLYYELQGNAKDLIADAPTRLTVVIPEWRKYALKGTVWIIAASWFLTIIVTAIFCCVVILVGQRRQLFYDNRTEIIRNLMQQLETPLSTMSVAVEALRNRRVMQNSEERDYYQQIIREESERMHDKLRTILEDQKIAGIS